MIGASFDGKLTADAAAGRWHPVHGIPTARTRPASRTWILNGAKITGTDRHDRRQFRWRAERRTPCRSVAICSCAMPTARETVDMVFAHVGGNLDLRGATPGRSRSLGCVNCRGLATRWARSPPSGRERWETRRPEPAQCAYRQSGGCEGCAWPAKGQLHLDGFTFNHLGGFEGETEPEMRARGMEWWDNWAQARS